MPYIRHRPSEPLLSYGLILAALVSVKVSVDTVWRIVRKPGHWRFLAPFVVLAPVAVVGFRSNRENPMANDLTFSQLRDTAEAATEPLFEGSRSEAALWAVEYMIRGDGGWGIPFGVANFIDTERVLQEWVGTHFRVVYHGTPGEGKGWRDHWVSLYPIPYYRK